MAPLPPGTIKLFQSTGSQAQHPSATVTVPPGFKILGGGARVSETGAGNMLTASYPTSIYSWTATAKDQDTADPQTITVCALAIYDPADAYDVQIFSATSSEPGVAGPVATVNVPSGYTLSGGGAQANYSFHGQFLITSSPNGAAAWSAASREHLTGDPGTVTAFAIGIRPAATNPSVTITSNVSGRQSENPQSHTSLAAYAPPGYVITCGGAKVSQGEAGNLLTSSYPTTGETGNHWQVSSQDQQFADPQRITAYAIGLKFQGQ